MGYSHHWTCRPEHPTWRADFARLQLELVPVFHYAAQAGISLAGWDPSCEDFVGGAGPQQEGLVAFNGTGVCPASGESLAGGAFWFGVDPLDWVGVQARPDGTRGWCKTGRKPYDLIVSVVLLRAAAVLGDACVVGSDGSWDAEWLHGARMWLPAEHRRGARQVYADLYGLEAARSNITLGRLAG